MFLVSIDEGDGIARQYDPVSVYKVKFIQGFTILIHPKVIQHEVETKKLVDELDYQLSKVVHVMPDKPLSIIRKVKIWVEWENKLNGAAEFHNSREWLINNAYNPMKAQDVEVTNVTNFISWSRSTQPWMILHELAHAYEYLQLRNEQDLINATYQNAVDMEIYDSVKYVLGGKKTAYALENSKEYFAELSESYFGVNDYYPFTRNDLMRHDLKGYLLMLKLWGNVNG